MASMLPEGKKKENSPKFYFPIPFLNTSPKAEINLLIYLIPVWWLLGFQFFIFQFLVLLMFVKFFITKLRKKEAIYLPQDALILLFFIMIYIASFTINIQNVQVYRALGSLNNLSFWIMGCLIIIIIHNSIKKEHIIEILKAFRTLGAFIGAFVMGSLVLWLSGYRYIQIHSLLSMAFPETVSLEKAPIIESALYPKVIITEYVFNQLSPRAYGFFIYPAALGGAMIFLIALTLAYSKMAGKKRITSLPILLLEFLALVLSLSRIAFLGLFLAWIVVSLYANLKKRWLSFSITLQVFLIVLIVFSLLVPPGQVINKMSELKKGSNITRMELYELTLRLILQRPLLGHGFKPREEEYPEPIGSHSMYLGTILKTGILGFLVFCVFWIRLIIKWIRQKSMVKNDKILGPLWYYLGISLIGGLIWMITEDLDAPPVVSFLYFIILGLIISLDRLSNSESKKSGNNATF